MLSNSYSRSLCWVCFLTCSFPVASGNPMWEKEDASLMLCVWLLDRACHGLEVVKHWIPKGRHARGACGLCLWEFLGGLFSCPGSQCASWIASSFLSPGNDTLPCGLEARGVKAVDPGSWEDVKAVFICMFPYFCIFPTALKSSPSCYNP